MEQHSSSVALPPARDAKSQLDAEWEAAAVEIASKIEGPLTRILKSAADGLYQEVLEATQDYLADNAQFNISSRLQSADRERRAQWVRAEAAERRAADLLSVLPEAVAAIGYLRAYLRDGSLGLTITPEFLERWSAAEAAAKAAMAKATSPADAAGPSAATDRTS